MLRMLIRIQPTVMLSNYLHESVYDILTSKVRLALFELIDIFDVSNDKAGHVCPPYIYCRSLVYLLPITSICLKLNELLCIFERSTPFPR